jgi:hypothetical protein
MAEAYVSSRNFDVVLGSGFRGHTVTIVLDGREVYRQAGVETDPFTSRADTFGATSARPRVHLLVRVTPGDLVASVGCDLRAHTRVTISLIGKASLWIETDAGVPAARWDEVRLRLDDALGTPAFMVRGL